VHCRIINGIKKNLQSTRLAEKPSYLLLYESYFAFLKTKIFMIRKATDKDFDFIYELYMHPQINRWLLYEQMDADSFLPIFNELLVKEILFVYENDGIPTGMCKLVPRQYRNAHIIYLGSVAIHPFFAGKGEGLNMLKEIKEHTIQKGFLRIELSVATINDKAIRLYEKAGFRKEGVLKNFTYLKSENKFLDEVMMAYLM
jgi:putative acetyltransferase